MNFHNIDINNNVPTKKIVIFAELVPRHAASYSAKVLISLLEEEQVFKMQSEISV